MQEPTTGLPLGDRMYNYRKHHYCFLAADGVDWVLKYSGIPQMHSRLNAVIVFQLLMDKYEFDSIFFTFSFLIFFPSFAYFWKRGTLSRAKSLSVFLGWPSFLCVSH